jgi:hypothetical protein
MLPSQKVCEGRYLRVRHKKIPGIKNLASRAGKWCETLGTDQFRFGPSWYETGTYQAGRVQASIERLLLNALVCLLGGIALGYRSAAEVLAGFETERLRKQKGPLCNWRVRKYPRESRLTPFSTR